MSWYWKYNTLVRRVLILRMIKLEFQRLLNDKISMFVTVFILLMYTYINFKMESLHFKADNNFYMRLFFLSPDNIELTNIYYFLVPLLSALVGSDLLGKDLRSKEYINIVSRYNKQRLLLSKAVVSFVAGGFVIVIPYIIDFILKLAIYPINLPSITIGASYQDIIGMSSIFVYHPMMYTIISMVMTFLFAGMCSLIGFLVSFYTSKKLIIISAPFLLSLALWNVINLFGLKDFSIQSILIFRVTQNIFSLGELVKLFLAPFIILLLAIYMGVKNNDFI